ASVKQATNQSASPNERRKVIAPPWNRGRDSPRLYRARGQIQRSSGLYHSWGLYNPCAAGRKNPSAAGATPCDTPLLASSPLEGPKLDARAGPAAQRPSAEIVPHWEALRPRRPRPQVE